MDVFVYIYILLLICIINIIIKGYMRCVVNGRGILRIYKVRCEEVALNLNYACKTGNNLCYMPFILLYNLFRITKKKCV